MQLVWVVSAGCVLACVYLATLHALLFGRDGSAASPLLTMACFIASSSAVLAIMALLAAGSYERLIGVLGGFLAARALLGRPLLGPLDASEEEEFVSGPSERPTRGAAAPSPAGGSARTAS